MHRTVLVVLALSTDAAELGGGPYQKLDKAAPVAGTCAGLKKEYKMAGCCGNPDKKTGFQLIPMQDHKSKTANPCAGTKPAPGAGFDNMACTVEGIIEASEQSGVNVTAGFQGTLNTDAVPITTPYRSNTPPLCPVNVHWHLGAEHYSVGQYDENGQGPDHEIHEDKDEGSSRRLADTARLGFRCHHYDENDEKFTKEYVWKHCADMYVGETYEVHWPHSSLGACETPFQYQSPFYDGVFCHLASLPGCSRDDGNCLHGVDVNRNVGVQGQVFTIVNDEDYYYPDLMRGWVIDGDYGADIAYYTGSTTGTSRSNQMCSKYAPITWQVDRKCHLISASSFDKMCADMKSQKADMSMDLYPHGARELVWRNMSANNMQRRV